MGTLSAAIHVGGARAALPESQWEAEVSDLSVPALVAVGLLIVGQAILYIVALVDLARRPADQVAGLNKWLWLAVILFVSTLGAILYLAIGRKPAAAAEGPTSAGPRAVRPEDVADALYGPDEGVGSA